MTCIAYKHPYLVADQRVTEGSTIFGHLDKIGTVITDDYKLYAAVAGNADLTHYVLEYIQYEQELIEWNQERFSYLERRLGVDNKDQDKVEVLGVLVTKQGIKLLAYDEDMVNCPAKADYYASGSGSRVALGAMAMGADAFKAVATACDINIACGFPINGYNVETGQAYHYKTPIELEMRAKESDHIKFGITVPELTKTLLQASKQLGRPATYEDLTQLKLF